MNIGFFPLLGVVFIILKLCGVIAWSWWLVLLPIYGSIILMVLIAIYMNYMLNGKIFQISLLGVQPYGLCAFFRFKMLRIFKYMLEEVI